MYLIFSKRKTITTALNVQADRNESLILKGFAECTTGQNRMKIRKTWRRLKKRFQNFPIEGLGG